MELIRPLKHRILVGSAWAFFGRISGAIVYLLLSVILVRLLEPAAVGQFFICISVATGAALFAQMGVAQAATKRIAEGISLSHFSRIRAIVSRVLGIAIAGILIVMLVLGSGGGRFLFADVFKQSDLLPLLPWVILWMGAVTLQIVLSEIFRGFHDIRVAALLGGTQTSGVISIAVSILVWLLLYATGVNIDLTILVKTVVIVSWAVVVLALLYTAHRVSLISSSKSDGRGAAERDIRVLPLLPAFFLVSVTVYVIQQSDLWLVAMFETPDQVAIYAAASRFVFAVGLPLMIFNGVLPPIVSELLAQKEASQLEHILRQSATIAAIFAGLLMLVLLIAGTWVLAVFFGDFYTAGYPILVILGLGKLSNVLAGSCGIVLLMSGWHRAAMQVSVVTGVVILSGAFLVGPRFGAEGIAVVYAVGLLFQNILLVFAVQKTVGIKTYVGRYTRKDLFTFPDALKNKSDNQPQSRNHE